MKCINILIALYILGSLVFTAGALFGYYHEWDDAYFIWSSNAHGGSLAWWAFYSIVPKSRKTDLCLVSILASSISVWELISLCVGWEINNPIAVFIIFIETVGIITYYGYIEYKQKTRYL